MVSRNAFDGTDFVFLNQEFAYPSDLGLGHVFVVQQRKYGIRKFMAPVQALVQLVACTILSSPYYVLASVPAETTEAVVLACNQIPPWLGHEDISQESVIIYLS